MTKPSKNVDTISVLVTDSDGAQTDVAMVTAAADEVIGVKTLTIHCDGDNTGTCDVRVGFGAANVPTPTTTGVAGLLADLRGCKAGGGVNKSLGGEYLGIGAAGEDLRYTCEDPAGGNVTISVTYDKWSA